jgi:teichuronic acid biosynthesis glycosyltransferase TuaC
MKVLSILAATQSPLGMIFTHRQIGSLEKLGVENQSFFIPAKGLTFRGLMRLARELRRTIKKFNPDLIHVQYGTIYAFVGAFTNCRPLVITFHGSDLNTLPAEKFIKTIQKKIFSNLAVLRAKQVICVSSAVGDNLWWMRKKVRIIPLGINLDEFSPMEKAAARKALHWRDEDVVVLFNANNPSVKRLDLAEQTLSLVRKSLPDARLEVLEGKVDNRQQIPLLLNAADCLLICSDSEGSPTMVKEALACNVPVVGVDVGDVRLRLDGVENSVVTTREPHAMAHAIIGVYHSGMRSNGREKLIADALTEEAVAEKILTVYRDTFRK